MGSQPWFAKDIEVFFKLLKSNFKFSNLKENNKSTDKKNQIRKIKIIITLK